MSQSVLFHCPCTEEVNLSKPPPSGAPLSTLEHHPLPELLFCEECDAIRCDNCAAHEIACYFCPNCLFEVISASVRAEKNRQVSPAPPHGPCCRPPGRLDACAGSSRGISRAEG